MSTMGSCLRFALALQLVLAPYAASAAPRMADAAMAEQATLGAIEIGTAHPEVILTALAANGESSETLKTFATDLKNSASPQAKIEIKKNLLYVNGKNTDILFTSYAPVQLSFHGKNWSYQKAKSLEQNYAEFKTFLSLKTAARGSLWLPKANASDELILPLLIGAGGIAGLFLSLAFAPIIGAEAALVYCVSAGSALGIIGGVALSPTAESAKREEIAKEIAHAQISLKCGPDSVELTGKGGGYSFKPGDKSSFLVLDANHHRAAKQPSEAQKASLMSTMPSCQNDADARRLNGDFQQAVKKLQEGSAAKPSHPSGHESGVVH